MAVAALILLVLSFFLQLLSASWYVMTAEMKKRRETITAKLLCSLLFLLDALLCAGVKGVFCERYFMAVFAGLSLFFAGTLCAEAKNKTVVRLAFFGPVFGSALYAVSFSVAMTEKFDVPFLNTVDLLSTGGAVVLFAALSFLKLFDFKGLRPAFIASACPALLAAVKAVHFGICCQNAGGSAEALSAALILGTAFLLCSGGALLLLRFGGKNNNLCRLIVSYTYFFGQMLIACTIFFV